VLDIGLPGADGITVCQRLRRDARLATPIIMLTARDQLQDKLSGFDVGADDYLVKPFDMPELEARLNALLRRRGGRAVTEQYELGDLHVDVPAATVTRAGMAIRLSKTQFEILTLLLRESPNVVSRQALERHVWGDEPPDSDALRSHLYNLRKAIDRPYAQELIETVPGVGLRIRAP